MKCPERTDDFEERSHHLRGLSDDELHERFWALTRRILEPLLEEARTYTTPSIERSVLLRMGLSSLEAKALVDRFQERGLLGRGAGRLVLELAQRKGISLNEAATALLNGEGWEELPS
ncbi:MAG: ornithine aminomutase [Gammaproteobacteria bacterium RIFOXYD12_FULL_61_37]|nr:MAG: ornithine aminomutase [Gammaproteobacteria bacterium RIFOXYD12_FULL_61_37]